MGRAVFQKYSEETEVQMKVFYGSLSEKEKRRYAAVEANKLGHGGQRYICNLLGCSPTTLRVGRAEILEGSVNPKEGIRRPGGGRKKITEKIENIDKIFLEIVEENTAGSPMNEDIKWTNLGDTGVAKKFEEKGQKVSPYVAKQLLEKHKYVKRKMRKTKTAKEAEQRNEQFENISKLREKYTNEGNPIMSIDVKKKSR
jgi:Rhodopirellula transposase DDE domain